MLRVAKRKDLRLFFFCVGRVPLGTGTNRRRETPALPVDPYLRACKSQYIPRSSLTVTRIDEPAR
jgi:hypothetical protein